MSETTTLQKLCRLSIVITTSNCRALAERAVESVLQQADPIGTEIIVADDGSRDGTADHIETVFAGAVVLGKLQVQKFDRCGDVGLTRNRAALCAQGTFLAFLDCKDYWKPGRLEWLEPLFRRHDLILATDDGIGESSDWVRAFLAANWAINSSAVIRRTLFDEVGGFPEGYTGFPLPKRLPGTIEYEFWLKCLLTLMKTGRRERFVLLPNQHVISGADPLAQTPIFTRLKIMRELITLMNVASGLPPRYWPLLARRVAESGRSFFKKAKRI